MSGNSREKDGRSPGRDASPNPVPSPGRRLQSVAKEKQELQVNVGIDFGTSSTKVIFTDRQFMPRYVCTFHDNPEGYPPVCLPSAVRVVDGKVYFGDEAERRTGGVLYRSFKMCMACTPADGRCRTCPNPLGDSERSGIFSHEGGTANLTAEEVSAWYLGYIVGLARLRVGNTFPGLSTRLTFQIAAPLKSCDSSVEKRAFEVAIHLATRIAPGVVQGVKLTNLRGLYRGEREILEGEGLPPESERDTCVIPETHSAVIGFVRSPASENGLYAIVDVGAGTTDISFLRLYHENNVLSYYSSEVTPTGGDAVDREILRRLLEGCGHTEAKSSPDALAKIRTAKHFDRPVDLGRGMSTDAVVCQAAASTVAGKIFTEYERTWARAYQKETKRATWERYDLYLCGGGSRLCPAFPNTFGKCPKPQSSVVQQVQARHFELPDGLVSDDGNGSPPGGYGYLLLVAYGVAFHRPRVPDWIVSGLVEPLDYKPEPVGPRSWDDYGKEGQWW